jgi:hypothetical protein
VHLMPLPRSIAFSLLLLACSGPSKPKPKPLPIRPTPIVVDRIPCSLPSFVSPPPVMWGVPDPSVPVGLGGLPMRWILTTDTIADLGAYIHSLHGWIKAAQICLESK